MNKRKARHVKRNLKRIDMRNLSAHQKKVLLADFETALKTLDKE